MARLAAYLRIARLGAGFMGSLWLVFLYTLVFAPCMLGLGFLTSNFAESQQQAMFTVWFYILIFLLMCGLFTPTDSMPVWAQWFNTINPVKYFVEFMRLVLLKGASFADIRQTGFGANQAITVTGGGTLSMQGGLSGSDNFARIRNDGINQQIGFPAGGAIVLTGGNGPNLSPDPLDRT